MCVVCAADTGDRSFCEKCWKALPLKMKQWFWRVTDFGKRPLTDDEVAHLTMETAKCREG